MLAVATGATGATGPTGPTPVTSLTFEHGIWLPLIVVIGSLLAGMVVIRSRRVVPGDPSAQPGSVIRSWIAVSLVIGLLVFCAAAFLVDDTSLRSTLFGGLVASVGAAIAFYFSSKTAEQARADVLTAAGMSPGSGTRPTKFTQASPPAATSGTPYQYQFLADGQPAPTYRQEGGRLPDGLTLDPDGTLHGKPGKPDSYTFSIGATNMSGSLPSADMTIVVA